MKNKASNKNKSLCEKSMKMMTNIIKLSSFSIAKMSLGSTDPAYSTKNHLASMTGSVIAASQPLLPQFPGSQRLQESESGARPHTYLIESVEGIGSSHVIREEKDDDEFAAYIRNFHKKRSDSYGTSMLSPYMLPPPHIIN